MSARSRYLAAISPTGSEGPTSPSVVSPTAGRSPAASPVGAQVKGLTSPSELRGRGPRGHFAHPAPSAAGAAVAVGDAPPPPPPPGPPPKRGKAKHSYPPQQPQVAPASEANAAAESRDPTVPSNAAGAPSPTSGRSPAASPAADSSGAAPAKAGTAWSPQHEIAGGSVAALTQKLWGSPKQSAPKKRAGTVANAYVANLSPAQRSLHGGVGAGGAGGGLPPATPPRAPMGPSPKYKRNAPPPLNREETPTLQHHQSDSGRWGKGPPRSGASAGRALPSPNRIGVRGASGSGASGSAGGGGGRGESPLRQRAGNRLSLTPLDTGFGGDEQGKEAEPPQPGAHGEAVVPSTPSSQRTPLGASPASLRKAPPPSSAYARSTSGGSREGVTTLTAFKRPNAKVGVVFTRLSSEHPEVAVISRVLPESIFARHRLASPHRGGGGGASMASSPNHAGEAGSHGANADGALEGAEVIAVNGTPVRDPRHAAELVARAKEEVRLTVKRGGMAAEEGAIEGGVGTDVAMEEEPAPPAAPRPPPLAAAPSIGDESALSARTERSALSARTEPEAAVSEIVAETLAQESIAESIAHDGASLATGATGVSGATGVHSTATPTSAAVAERRRKVAAAMLLSEELVEDPLLAAIRENPSMSSQEGREGNEAAEEGVEASELAPVAMGRTPSGISGISAAHSGVSGASAADRRRRAALEMYHATDLVADNVDDARLGTIDAVSSPHAAQNKEVVAPAPPIPMTRVASATGTDVTTSTVATARMGGNTPRKNAPRGPPVHPTDAADESASVMEESVAAASAAVAGALLARTSSPGAASPSGVVSPAAQRRKERARARMGGAPSVESPRNIGGATYSPKGPLADPGGANEVDALPPAAPSVAPAPSAAEQSVVPVPSLQSSKTDEESLAASLGSSDVPQARSARFGRKKKGAAGDAPSPEPSKKKQGKKSIFGVARLIRKATAKKSKKGTHYTMEDGGLFEEDGGADAEVAAAKDGNEAHASAAASAPNVTEVEEAAAPPPLQDPPPPLMAAPDATTTTVDPFHTAKDDDADWSAFDADPFAAFDAAAAADDEEGFADPFSASFDPAKDAWGEMAPVDFTPKNKNTSGGTSATFGAGAEDGGDAVSHDGTEMSGLTNPTYASHGVVSSRPDPAEEKSRDSDGTEVTKEKKKLPPSYNKKKAVDPPLPQIASGDASDDARDDREDASVSSAFAKSRILSKYARGQRARRTSASPARKASPSRATVPPLLPPSNEAAPVRQGAAARGKEWGVDPATTSASTHRRRRMSPNRLDRGASSTIGVANARSLKASPSRDSTRYGARKKKASPSVVDDPRYYSMEARLAQIKDPIQRAGVRLLWAAAIPIQTQARRFLARQSAIRRMCSVLTIQAFVRRWLAERDLEIAVWSAIQIQSSFRGWFARDSLEDNHYCAIQIQRVVRGHLATMRVFEDLYSVTIVQSVVRRHLAINDAVDRLSSVIAMQSWWRGIEARERLADQECGAVAIQAHWRRYLAQTAYQFDIIDVIIVQSVVRRWRTRRALAAGRLQCFARVVLAKTKVAEQQALHSLVARHTSATMIQARWRSHVARTMLRHYIAATRIQACWRSYAAQVHMLVAIVNVIVIQSLWRRRAAVKLYRPLLHRIRKAKDRKRVHSVVAIQSAWRGFAVYSTFLIRRYESRAAATIQAHWRGHWQATTYSIMYCGVVKIQALVRGHQERSWQAFRNECATVVQATCRRFLVRREVHNEHMVSILIAAAAHSLRVRNAARKLQGWWGEEMWRRKERWAAVVIERFFVYVKKEVEKEVRALKKKKKERRRRRKVKQSDDYILERAWLGVEAEAVPEAVPPRTVGTPKTAYDNRSSAVEDDRSDVSGLTDLDFGTRNGRGAPRQGQRSYPRRYDR